MVIDAIALIAVLIQPATPAHQFLNAVKPFFTAFFIGVIREDAFFLIQLMIGPIGTPFVEIPSDAGVPDATPPASRPEPPVAAPAMLVTVVEFTAEADTGVADAADTPTVLIIAPATIAPMTLTVRIRFIAFP